MPEPKIQESLPRLCWEIQIIVYVLHIYQAVHEARRGSMWDVLSIGMYPTTQPTQPAVAVHAVLRAGSHLQGVHGFECSGDVVAAAPEPGPGGLLKATTATARCTMYSVVAASWYRSWSRYGMYPVSSDDLLCSNVLTVPVPSEEIEIRGSKPDTGTKVRMGWGEAKESRGASWLRLRLFAIWDLGRGTVEPRERCGISSDFSLFSLSSQLFWGIPGILNFMREQGNIE
ncbi:hypothetical protein GGX14DRAFT_387393 [Mycena pura]|uniref:Uncharacterized protein n=1 Tax=Mycena pura TaxID=153505 RepID=A0AAD6YLN1_9AGAR|nr:hypothetical protein GGX14DRAFT_387393 [Mycena pura]